MASDPDYEIAAGLINEASAKLITALEITDGEKIFLVATKLGEGRGVAIQTRVEPNSDEKAWVYKAVKHG